jgi:hypothetical protein
MKKYLILLCFAILGIIMFSCEQPVEEEEPTTTEQTLNALKESSIVNKMYCDVFSEADDAAKYTDAQISGKNNGRKSTYPIITITPLDATTWPKTVTVDYGTLNFLCTDMRFRRGIISFETTGFYREPGTVITITFDNFYQNDYKLEGTQIVTNEGRNPENNLYYSVLITDGLVITPNNKTILYDENTSREWAEGESTATDLCDDTYFVTGTQSGLSSDSIAYDLTIQQKLDIKVCCAFIRAGILDVNIEGGSTISIDYGDGTCDNEASATLLGTVYPIEL